MKENLKYSLFFGAVFTVVLTLAYGNWYGFSKITVTLAARIFLVMTILCMTALGAAGRSAGKHLEGLKEEPDEELFGEEESKASKNFRNEGEKKDNFKEL